MFRWNRHGLVGRVPERTFLAAAVQRLHEGRGGAAAVAGDPGLGKSALLAEVAAIAAPAPVRHTGWESWTALPDAVIAASRAGPVVVIADDLHVVQPPTAMLRTLLSLTQDRPVLVVLAYRPRQLPARLAAVLSEVATIGLAPLSPAEAEALLEGRDDAETIHREGDGNPLYLLALSGASPERTSALTVDLARLTDEQRRLAQIAAALGDPFTLDLLAEVAGTEPETTGRAVDALAAADVVRAAGPALFAFRHPVVTTAIAENTEPSVRRAAHRRTDEVLRARGVPVERRAKHTAMTAEWAEPQDIATLLSAAQRVLTTDPATAADWLDIVTTLLREDDRRWYEAQLLLARAQLLLGAAPASRVRLDMLSQRASGATVEQRAALAVYSGQTDRQLGRPREANSALTLGLHTTSSIRTPHHVTLHLEIASLAGDALDLDASIEHARTAADLAGRYRNPVGVARASGLQAMALAGVGDAEAAGRLTTLAGQIVDATSDADLAEDLLCLSTLGFAEATLELFWDADRHVTRGVALARQTGQVHVLPELLKSSADVQLRRGRLRDALAACDGARVPALDHQAPPFRWLLATTRAEALVWLGGAGEAAVLPLAESVLAACVDAPHVWAMVCCGRVADILVQLGQPDRGRRLLLAAGGGPELPRLAAGRRTRWWECLVRAALAEGDLAAADRFGRLAAARTETTPGRMAYAAQARMLVAAAHGDRWTALDHAATAAARFKDGGMLLDLGRIYLDTAHIHLDAADPDPTQVSENLDAAAELARLCGSGRLLAQVDEVRTRSAGPLAAPSGPLAGLTGRELEVAELAGGGLSSQEIASKLHLSVRTVDGHLGRVYRKLDVTSRTALAVVLHATTQRAAGSGTA